jgi:hypothetical protein
MFFARDRPEGAVESSAERLVGDNRIGVPDASKQLEFLGYEMADIRIRGQEAFH